LLAHETGVATARRFVQRLIVSRAIGSLPAGIGRDIATAAASSRVMQREPGHNRPQCQRLYVRRPEEVQRSYVDDWRALAMSMTLEQRSAALVKGERILTHQSRIPRPLP
jgi:hypothetical protein